MPLPHLDERGEKMNPISSLLRSRKFLLMALDVVIALVLYFVGKYAGQGIFDDINTVIILMQPVFVSVIIGIAVEDSAEKSSYQYLPGGEDVVAGE